MISFPTLIGALLALAICAVPTSARGLKDYQQTVWTQQDGAPTELTALAQTTDGWLWIGSGDGVFRFDGVNFEPYSPPGQPQLAHQRVVEMYAADNGDLYISYFPREVAVVRANGQVELLAQPKDFRRNPPLSMALDQDRSLWTIGNGIRRYANGEWSTVEDDPVWNGDGSFSLLLDQEQRLWASSPSGVWRLDRASGRFVQISKQGGGLAIAANGDVWTVAPQGGPAIRVAASSAGKPRPLQAAAMGSRAAGQFTSDGTLWALGCPELACLVHDAMTRDGPLLPARDAQERVYSTGSAAGQEALGMLEDRENNLWIMTHNALSRFRPKRFLTPGFELEDFYYSAAADGAGALWVAETAAGKLWRLGPDAVPQPQPQPGPPVYMLASGRDGALLRVGERSISRVLNGATQTIALPLDEEGKPLGRKLFGLLDDGERLWTGSTATGAIAWVDRQWQPIAALGLPSRIYLSQADGPGQLWLALSTGELVFHDHGKLARYDATPVGIATGIFPGPPLLLGGTEGLAMLRDGKLHMLRGAEPNALRGVSGIAVTADGDRWLNGVAGVVHVRAQDWQRAMAQPDEPLRYELFGVADGYPGRASVKMRRPTAISPDGRHVWFITTTGIVGLDSANLRRNPVAPKAVVLEVSTDAARFDAAQDVNLPAGAGNFRLRFSALSTRQPERTRFEYQLDGVDATWRDAGNRRTTSYTNVAPGQYLFRVRAINEDGVVSTEAATVRLTLAPTLVQSLPFRLACAAALVLLAVLLYRLRVRYLTARLLERLQIKLAERERIARTLHDTFLQSVQAMLLRLRKFERGLPEPTRDELHTLLGEVQGVIDEGRDQVHELRDPAIRTLDDVLRDSAAGLAALHPEVAFTLDSEGADPGLAPCVLDEAGLIAGEALRNAYSHAQAGRIDVRISYGPHGCTLQVRDDGCGLDEEAARARQRDGHWGLVGMRERAARIGARLQIDSKAGHGTTVTLTIPSSTSHGF